MALALFKPTARSTHPTKATEPRLDQVGFTVHKFNNRPRPARDRVLIISCFSEFGCETIGCMYCIPRILKRFPGRYIIVMGWHGRSYLYQHLVDEFWEINEEHMWLRDYTYAFHHFSGNLKRLEQSASQDGSVLPASMLGKYVIGNYCRTCGKFWNEWRKESPNCPACKSTYIVKSVFGNIDEYKSTATRIPQPSDAATESVKKFIKPNMVGIFARNRTTYGRNLPPEFYIKLINHLESHGYSVIWLGEKQNVLPCPVEHVTDFSRMPEARDLEKTLAIICQLEFTIQFWTASSRLSAMMGKPYILFESPEQIYCGWKNQGQEGKRLELSTFGPRKLVLSHYLSVLSDHEGAMAYVDQAIGELKAGNSADMIGMVESPKATKQLMDQYYDQCFGKHGQQSGFILASGG